MVAVSDRNPTDAPATPTPLNPDPKDTPLPTPTGVSEDRVPAQGLGDGRPVIAARSGDEATRINPWLFVPVLYFMQFLPNGVVTSLFLAVYKSLGVDNMRIATWTGLAALPWTFKMFWGPLVDLNSTKRRWTMAMQLLLSVTLLFTAGAIATDNFFPITVALMFAIATFSATHDIACDGLYLMSLDKKRQAAFSGVMAASSRLGRLFVDAFLIVIAGRMIRNGMDGQRAWMIGIGIAAIIYSVGALWNFFMLPRPPKDVPAVDVAPEERNRNILRTLVIIGTGVVAYYFIAAVMALTGDAIHANVAAGAVPAKWDLDAAGQRVRWIRLLICAAALPLLWILIRRLVRGTPMGDAFVSYVRQPGFPAILAFIFFYRFGEAMIFVMVPLFMLDTVAAGGLGISLEGLGLIKGAGQVAGLIAGGLIGGWWIAKVGLRRAFWPIVVCLHVPNLLYVWTAFDQGLARMDLQVGGLTISSWPLYPIVFVEAAGYGVGFAAYFVYLMFVAQRGKYVTSHYAIGTGLGAFFITMATITAGIVHQVWGYKGVFIAACILTIPGVLTLLFIPLEDDDTRRVTSEAGG